MSLHQWNNILVYEVILQDKCVVGPEVTDVRE